MENQAPERTPRLERRAATHPIRVDPHTLANQRHRIGLLLRNILPSYKGVVMVVEALRLQARYRACYASASHLAGRAGASPRTWWRVLKLLRQNGLATAERLLNTATGKLSVNLLDLTELWRLLLFLLKNSTPFLRNEPGCWKAWRTRVGKLVIPPLESGYLGIEWVLQQVRDAQDVMIEHGDDPNLVRPSEAPPAWTQPWWLEWVVKANDVGTEWVFPTVRTKAEAIRAEFAA